MSGGEAGILSAKKILFVAFSYVLLLATSALAGGISGLREEVKTDCVSVVAPGYLLDYDPENDVVIVFAPPNDEVDVRVTPLGGWFWNMSCDDDRMLIISLSRQIAKQITKTGKSGRSYSESKWSKPVYQKSGEGRSTVTVVKHDIYAYLKIDKKIGLDMRDASDESLFVNRNSHIASVIVVPDGSPKFVVDKDKPCSWQISRCEQEKESKYDMIVKYVPQKRGSSRIDAEKVSVYVSGKLDGVQRILSASIPFTIIQVDVCIGNVPETGLSNEDNPGFECEKTSFSKTPVTFRCVPSDEAKNVTDVKFDRVRLCSDTSLGRRVVDQEKLTPEVLFSNTQRFYLDVSQTGEGAVEVVHKSYACDVAKSMCWGFEFLKPHGDPVADPMEDENEYCYEDTTRKCLVDFEVGTNPRKPKNMTIASIKQKYKDAKFVVDKMFDEPEVKLVWDATLGGQKGVWSDKDGKITCHARCVYDGMPKKHNSFGLKHVKYGVGATALSAEFEVFFPKTGVGHPACEKCSGCPNWFYYWKQDAVPVLNDSHVIYQDIGRIDGQYSSADDKILISAGAASERVEFKVQKYKFEDAEQVVGNVRKGVRGAVESEGIKIGASSEYKGVACAAAVVRHEQRHRELFLASKGFVDTDGDGVADYLESGLGMYAEMAASYNFLDEPIEILEIRDRQRYQTEYASYADCEIQARIAEREVMKNVEENIKLYHWRMDWAKPGSQCKDPYGPPECKITRTKSK